MKRKTTKPKYKTVSAKLKFGKYSHCLYTTSTSNFIHEQPDRFELLEGRAHIKGGTLYFCNTYLEAIVVMAIFKGVALYSDEQDGGGFVVVSKKRFVMPKVNS